MFCSTAFVRSSRHLSNVLTFVHQMFSSCTNLLWSQKVNDERSSTQTKIDLFILIVLCFQKVFDLNSDPDGMDFTVHSHSATSLYYNIYCFLM